MRILYVATRIPFPQESGGTTHIRSVVRELMRRGHEIVLCANVGDGLPEGEVEGMRTYRFTWRYRDVNVSQVAHRWTHGIRVAQLAKKYQADLIYERESSMGSGALAAKLTGLPLVVEVNDHWYHPMSLERASRILSVTGGSRRTIPEEHHHKTRFLHNAVDMALFDDSTPMAIEGLKGRRGICYTGSMLAWHGLPDLADALPHLLDKVPDAALVIAGEAKSDEQREVLSSLKSAAEGAGDPGAVILLGRVPHGDIPAILAAGEVCVAPFNPEGERDLVRYGFFYSPLKLWEYMAAGRAVVSTDIPNIREIVGEDRGTLVPPGEPLALARAIADLLLDGEQRMGMGMKGRAFAQENTWEKRVDEYERALNEAMEGG
ncbi:MAG: glycosyltransferase family 4 protein [Thermoplasmata archaeon]|nr:MAG: glycosyltransferase family 4 protein [Thermoplasmata archaeon]